MSDILKTMLQRGIQAAVVAIAGWLVSAGYLSSNSEQSFIGAGFFLIAWAVDTFIVHKQKADAAIVGGEAVGNASASNFTTAQIKSIVKDTPK